MPRTVKFSPMPMGGFVADIGSDVFQLLWTGPGSHGLYLAGKSGGLVPIEPDKYRHDGTNKGARAAARLFVNDGPNAA